MSTHETSHEELLAELGRGGEVASALEAGLRDRAPGGVLAAAADEFYILDLSGRIVEANRRACMELGYAPEELVGRPVWEIGTRQTAAGFERLMLAIEAEGPQYLFGHNRRKDGSTYPVEARLWIALHAGTPHVFALVRDSRGYQGLIEERDQLVSLIENTAEVICVATPEGICSYMNPAGRELLGIVGLHHVAGKGLWEFHPPERRAFIEEEVLPAMRGGRWQGELAYRRLAGDGETPCWVNAFAIRHSQTGAVLGLAVIAHDILERKAAEAHRQKLLELNEVSRNVATSLLEKDNLNRALAIVLEGVGRILKVSRSFLCRYREEGTWVFRTHEWFAAQGEAHPVEHRPEEAGLYGWATRILQRGQPIAIVDMDSTDLVPAEESGVLRPDVRALLLLPVLVGGNLESFFGFADTNGPREWEDEELAILQIIVDSFARAIERRIAERESEVIARDLEKSVARERAANRYKSEFLANMSHELRTPMNSIVGYAELLGRPNVDPEKQSTWVKHIQRSTNYLLSLINDVLDLSKLEAGQMRVSIESCSLAETFSDVEELLRGQAEEKLLEFSFEERGDVPDWIETDPVRLKQVLVNLVGNAIKFTSEGSVVVRTSTEELVGPGPSNRRLRIDVVDTGIGIERESLERLFRPFTQVHSRGDSRVGGTGLGLDISRHLARLLGGEIEVDSEVGRGSVFTLRLPLVGADAPEGASAGRVSSLEVESVRGRRILIVDDCEENRDVLRFLLEESGCVVVTAADGEQGVAEATRAARAGAPYDAVLMDMNMPVKDGLTATRELVALGVGSPIIALTALALAGDEDRCREAGCVDYISKPVVPSRFFQTITRHLGTEASSAAQAPASAGPKGNGGLEKAGKPAEDLIQTLVDNPRFRPLIQRYVSSFGDLARELRQHFADGDLHQLRTRVHRLRGTASNYGFPEISQAAGRCEDLIRSEAGRQGIEAALGDLEELMRAAHELRAGP